MAIVNKVTKIYPEAGSSICEETIQSHLDEQNQDGWNLIFIDNLSGWYRFFWQKEIE